MSAAHKHPAPSNVHGLYNVKIHGAKGDGLNDDTTAIQNAINAACAAAMSVRGVYTTPTIYLPAGAYLVSAPLIVNCVRQITLIGDSRESTQIVGANTKMPILYIEPWTNVHHLGTRRAASLATGSGNALNWDTGALPNGGSYWYNLNDVLDSAAANTGGGQLNGLSQFDFEAYIYFDSTLGRNGVAYYLSDSSGADTGAAENFTNSWGAYALYVVQGARTSTLHGCLNTSVTGGQCITGRITNQTVTAIELSYDGATLRLFAGGSLLASAVQNGTVVQPAAEATILGDGPSHGFGASASGGTNRWRGTVDSIRISKVARHKDPYTAPTRKFSSDPNTLLLINGASFPDSFLVADSVYNGTGGYLPAYCENCGNNGSTVITVRHLTFNTGSYGILNVGAIQGYASDIYVWTTSVFGIKNWTAYGWRFDDINIVPQGYSEGAFAMLTATGITYATNLQLSCGLACAVLMDSGGLFSHIFMGPGVSTLLGIDATTNAVYTFDDLDFDTENGGSMIPLKFSYIGTYNIRGSTLQTNSAACNIPAIDAEPNNSGLMNINIVGTTASLCATAPEVVHIGTQTEPVAPSILTPFTWIGGGVSAGTVTPITKTTIPISNKAGFVAPLDGLAQYATVLNDTGTGTVINKLTKLTGAPSTAVIAATTDTTGVIGITTGGAGTREVATICIHGICPCVFDGATTAGDYVQISRSTRGDCHDTGAATWPANNEVVGTVLSTNVGGGTYKVLVNLQR